jgi:hypothetical protein
MSLLKPGAYYWFSSSRKRMQNEILKGPWDAAKSDLSRAESEL